MHKGKNFTPEDTTKRVWNQLKDKALGDLERFKTNACGP